MDRYQPGDIESKWQRYWEEHETYRTDIDPARKKFYALVEFPYPSGDGLHTGHVRGYTAMDVIARKRRMEGYNVLYPIGWDAFGLPTENYAIKTGMRPEEVTRRNTDNFRRQMKALGFGFDWSREIDTTDPEYYKWTQWIFLKLHEQGLAYKAAMEINWCPSCKIGLANEEAQGGVCERCGGPTEKREKEQWMLAITRYADRLDCDLDTVDYWDKIKVQQRNWIGRSEGAEVVFKLADVPGQEDGKHSVTVFTTRVDTIFGATYLAVSAELAKKWMDFGWQASDEVRRYVGQTLEEHVRAGREEIAEKTGVFSGVSAVNPFNGEKIPVWIANYVLGEYGTGAVMAVPAHDERDLEFSKKYGLPIRISIGGGMDEECFVDDGVLVGSGEFSDLKSSEAREKMTAWLEERGLGKGQVNYKLRDWVFSRQRYWGEPIPMVHCKKDGWVPLPESELPLRLPEVEKYQPTDTGESPLAAIEDWVATTCPVCGGPARRETDTMPNWAGSSWYYLRYADPRNAEALAGKEALEYWMGPPARNASAPADAGGVDWYNGGMEHTTLHLLYSRFWHKFLYDLGVVPTSEPYMKRTSHGLILAEGGVKMSKSKGNVVNPDTVVAEYGADTLRVYEMFMGPFDQHVAWSTESIAGSRRFLEKAWKLREKMTDDRRPTTDDKKIQTIIHKTIKKVTEDIEGMRFNTAISALMILVNEMEKEGTVARKEYETLLVLLSPFAPHIAEELWASLGHTESIFTEAKWPEADPKYLVEETVEIVVQVNGRLRGRLSVTTGADQETVENLAKADPCVSPHIDGKTVRKVIFVPDRLVNFVVN